MADTIDQLSTRTGASARHAYALITSEILSGALRPGQRVVLRQLAAQLGLGATSVREALLRLVAEGGLDLDDRSSVQIPVVGTEEMEEMLALRRQLETRAVTLAAGIHSKTLVNALVDAQSSFARIVRSNDAGLAAICDHAFHIELVRGSRSPGLIRLIEGLRARLSSVAAVGPGDPSEHLLRHERIICAVDKGDRTDARAALEADLHLHERSTAP